jgi:hypothetical protein
MTLAGASIPSLDAPTALAAPPSPLPPPPQISLRNTNIPTNLRWYQQY